MKIGLLVFLSFITPLAVVNPPPSFANASPLPSWTVNRRYSQAITAAGGTGALSFADSGGTLPNWLTISTAGLLRGTPPSAGPFTFTLRVTDSLGHLLPGLTR